MSADAYVIEDTNGDYDVFVRDHEHDTTEPVSVHSAGGTGAAGCPSGILR